MNTEPKGPKKGATQRFRELYNKRREDTRKKNQEKAKTLQTPDKKSAKPLPESDMEA